MEDITRGGQFLVKETKCENVFTPEDFTEEQNMMKDAVIEFTDLIFAVDSFPAIFAIAPNDPFILYTSNIFAILGLRSLYFLLANFIHMFSRLKFGLAIILAFIGFKMIISPFYHISSPLSLSVVASILILSVAASILYPVKESEN